MIALPTWLTPARRWLAVALFSAAAVGSALYSQHVLGMQPCPWCILQRMIFMVIAMLALVGAALSRAPGVAGKAMAVPVALLAACGVAAAGWQNQVAAKSASCNLTLADRIITGSGLDARWPDLFEVRASCADAVAALLGVPVELWSLALYLLVLATMLTLLRRSR